MRITHEYPVKVFTREFNGKKVYSIGISKKDVQGNYINGFIDAKFRKDVEVDDSKKIYIKDAWLDFYLDKDNKTRHYIFINQFEYVEDVVKDSKATGEDVEKAGTIYSDEIEITDDDLPF